MGNTQNCGQCERYSLARYTIQRWEPTFRSLLLTAGAIEFNHLHVDRISKVRKPRVVERKMSVLANTHEAHLRADFPQQPRVLIACRCRVRCIPMDRMKSAQGHAARQVLRKIVAERSLDHLGGFPHTRPMRTNDLPPRHIITARRARSEL